MGIDPGSRKIGLACVRSGAEIVSCADALIRVKGRGIGQRLDSAYEQVERHLQEWNPDEIAMEDVFSHINVRSAVVLSRVTGVLLLLVHRHGLPVELYAPRQVKAAVTHGGADKGQVNYVVRNTLNLKNQPAEDVSDAYAVALCHLFRRRELYSP